MTSDAKPRPPRRRPKGPATQRRRVLFIGEGSTLAHAVRPLALAAALPRDRFEAVLAAPERYRRWAPAGLEFRPLEAQGPETFAERVRAGKPLFSKARLEGYVADDLALIEAVRPHVVVGDFRMSLAASARLAATPYISISNAYWHPGRQMAPVRPPMKLFDRWPAPLADVAARLLWRPAMRWHAKPVHELLTGRGLEGVDRDVRRAFTEADLTLYADFPALFPEVREDERYGFLGPLTWEPPVALPPWWGDTPDDRPIAYVTLGSSGDMATLDRVVGWLGAMGYTVLLALAERASIPGDGRNLFTADYLPGMTACERADIVICNGGSPTTTQALLNGRPVLGIAGNMDQLLNMRAVQAAGAGVCLRADRLARGRFESAVNRLAGFRASKAAVRFSALGAEHDPARVLEDAIERLAPPSL